MGLRAHRPDARFSRAVLLYEGDAGLRAAHGNDPHDDGYDVQTGLPHPWNRLAFERGSSGPPPATGAARDALTRWPDSLFRAEPGRVVTFDTTSPEGSSGFADLIRDARDLLLVHWARAVDTGDDRRWTTTPRAGLSLGHLLQVIDRAPARHVVVVLESDRPDAPWGDEAFHGPYTYAARRVTGRLTLIANDPDPRFPRPFLADALGGDGPLTAHTLAAHPRARPVAVDGHDVRLTASGRSEDRETALRNSGRALTQSLARTRPALTKARESTVAAVSAAAPFALLLLAVAVVAGGLFALLRALPPMRGTWAAVALLGLWAVLAVVGIITRLRTPPTRARPPDKASSPAPRSQAFTDGVWAAWGFPGPVPQPTGRPRQPVPPRPTREESRAAVERSLNALYARLPVPQMRAPDPPPSPAAPSSPSPDDNGTTP